MAGRPVRLENVVLVQKLRKKKPPVPFRMIVEEFKNRGEKTDVKTVFRWANYDVGKIIKKSS